MPRMNLDLALDNEQPPMPGDVLVTARTVYRVLDSRLVDSRVWDNRWALHLDVIARCASSVALADAVMHAVDDDERVFYSERYRRGETPRDYFGVA